MPNPRTPKSAGVGRLVDNEEKLVVREANAGTFSIYSEGVRDDDMDAMDPVRETVLRCDLADTGITTPSPPRPKRENLGVGSVFVTQFVPGSRDMDGRRVCEAIVGGAGTIASVDTDLRCIVLGLLKSKSGVHEILDGLYFPLSSSSREDCRARGDDRRVLAVAGLRGVARGFSGA